MTDANHELEKAHSLSVRELAQSIQEIGFECTQCGECCKGTEGDEHVATIFPDEIRSVKSDDEAWEDVAQPMPYGLTRDGNETFEWALQTSECGNCVFFDEGEDGGVCSRYNDRPLICETYPFSVEFHEDGQDTPVVDQAGVVRAHECEGLGRDIEWEDALALAKALKRRAVTEAREATQVIETYREAPESLTGNVVYDSEGIKRPDGTQYKERERLESEPRSEEKTN